MHDDDSDLTPKQLTALAALLGGQTVESAAAAADCDPSTLRRWLRDPLFAEEYRRRRRQLVDETMAVLLAVGRTAAATVLKLMADERIAASVRLRAAQVVLERLQQWAELEDIAERLSKLEERYADY